MPRLSYAVLRTHSWCAPSGQYRVAATRRDLAAALDVAGRMLRRGRAVKVVQLAVPLGAGEHIARHVADRLPSFPVAAV